MFIFYLPWSNRFHPAEILLQSHFIVIRVKEKKPEREPVCAQKTPLQEMQLSGG